MAAKKKAGSKPPGRSRGSGRSAAAGSTPAAGKTRKAAGRVPGASAAGQPVRARKTVKKLARKSGPKLAPASSKAIRPPATSATALDPIQFPEERPRKVKTHLTAKQLREFKELLLQKRAELAGDVRRLTSEALHRNDNGSGDHSTMPIHMADLGTDNWEQDFTLGLIANEEALVRDIDDALARIEDKTYGICVATDQPISIARLLAKPWAKYCIEYARAREEGRAP